MDIYKFVVNINVNYIEHDILIYYPVYARFIDFFKVNQRVIISSIINKCLFFDDISSYEEVSIEKKNVSDIFILQKRGYLQKSSLSDYNQKSGYWILTFYSLMNGNEIIDFTMI